MVYSEDTIVAISTPQGTGGIGVIRISGKGAFDIASKIFRGKKKFDDIKSHTINYGKIINFPSDEVIDEVLMSKMKAPNTFTKEDIIEINTHGNQIILKNIIELIVKSGARIAEPGEFTKRAFLNGRIDLSQAEAVIDLINSKTLDSSRAAIGQLEGRLSKKLKNIREELVKLIAHIEVTVDYPEHDIEEITGKEVYRGLKEIRKIIHETLITYEKGKILRDGLNIVIVGKPNVGKSSLLNELIGKNKAIVTNIPGTTRDVIEEYINLAGVPVKLMDTAGIRETKDVVEQIGVEKTKKELMDADLVVFLVDAISGFMDEDKEILDFVRNKKILVLLNKIDLISYQEQEILLEDIRKNIDTDVLKVSVKEEIGIKEFEEYIKDKFLKGEVNLNNEVLLTNVRHKDLLLKSFNSIEEAMSSYEAQMPLDIITIDIKNAAEAVGEITGESVSDLVVHEIFSRFCLGK